MPMKLQAISWHMRVSRFRDLMDQVEEATFAIKSSQGWGLLEGGPLTLADRPNLWAIWGHIGGSRFRDRISGKKHPRGRASHFEKFFQLVLTNRKFGAGRPLSRRQIIPPFAALVKSFLKIFSMFHVQQKGDF